MACRASSGLPVWAATNSFSSMSVILEIAECTTSTRCPAASRRLTTNAMLRQLTSVETLVPPNLTTTQPDTERADMRLPSPCLARHSLFMCFEEGAGPLFLVFESFFQVFLETTVREDFFEPAPGRLAAFGSTGRRTNAALDFVEHAVVIGVVFR